MLNKAQYSFGSRFEEGKGTNPEELIGAAHAGCFSMKLSGNLQQAGHKAESIDTKATVIMTEGAINEIQLQTKVKASGLENDKFQELAEDAKANCPISKLFTADIKLEAELVQ